MFLIISVPRPDSYFLQNQYATHQRSAWRVDLFSWHWAIVGRKCVSSFLLVICGINSWALLHGLLLPCCRSSTGTWPWDNVSVKDTHFYHLLYIISRFDITCNFAIQVIWQWFTAFINQIHATSLCYRHKALNQLWISQQLNLFIYLFISNILLRKTEKCQSHIIKPKLGGQKKPTRKLCSRCSMLHRWHWLLIGLI